MNDPLRLRWIKPLTFRILLGKDTHFFPLYLLAFGSFVSYISCSRGVLEGSNRTGLFPIVWLLKWFKSLVAFITISIPRMIYSILSYSMTLTVSFIPTEFPPSRLEPHTAQFLVLCNNVCARCGGIQLLASIPLSERILRVSRTSSREVRRTRVAPRRQHPRPTNYVS